MDVRKYVALITGGRDKIYFLISYIERTNIDSSYRVNRLLQFNIAHEILIRIIAFNFSFKCI